MEPFQSLAKPRSSRWGIAVREWDNIQWVGRKTPIKIFEIMGEKGRVDSRSLLVVEHYQEGCQAYLYRNWNDVVRHFQSIYKVGIIISRSKVLWERGLTYQKTPLLEEWNPLDYL